MIGCLLAESGLSYDDVIARIAELRAGTRKAAYPCPESTTQHDLPRARCVRRRRPRARPPYQLAGE
ncbi:hypothetical protein A5719_00050 [Mycolicibacterium peregrinum]|nr:hypothetical protein A5719_00050 [Mycolicibacterium peregrinum]